MVPKNRVASLWNLLHISFAGDVSPNEERLGVLLFQLLLNGLTSLEILVNQNDVGPSAANPDRWRGQSQNLLH